MRLWHWTQWHMPFISLLYQEDFPVPLEAIVPVVPPWSLRQQKLVRHGYIGTSPFTTAEFPIFSSFPSCLSIKKKNDQLRRNNAQTYGIILWVAKRVGYMALWERAFVPKDDASSLPRTHIAVHNHLWLQFQGIWCAPLTSMGNWNVHCVHICREDIHMCRIKSI